VDGTGRRITVGAGVALAVCCTVHLVVLAGGVGVVGGVLGGVVGNPYVIVAGLVMLTGAIAALVVRRAGRSGVAGGCCPPSAGTEVDRASRRDTGTR